MTHEDLENALEVFELPLRATLKEIKRRHKSMVRRHHPDGGTRPDPEAMRRINAAYSLLMEYCGSYRFSFTREEFYQQNPEARLRDQFNEDFLWNGHG